MSNDPGLLTDSTGEGMAGAEDVRYSTQQALKQTMYNGSKECTKCGTMITPVHALYNELCPNCTRRSAFNKVKGGMA